jgi:hypothetical protein
MSTAPPLVCHPLPTFTRCPSPPNPHPQAYEAGWRALASAAGLGAGCVLDLRGNHDAFDTLRGSDKVCPSYCVLTNGVWEVEAETGER